MRTIYLGMTLLLAAGCTRLDAVPIQPTPFAEKDCTAVAMAAVKDAAQDEYDAVMQDVVYKNSYNACEQAKALAKK
ncbi:MAG TPA: hypothetical protein VN718_03990 [Rhizomicrobium sp.]|nr:hypothetical protein [Rhizomicrobium sp.]